MEQDCRCNLACLQKFASDPDVCEKVMAFKKKLSDMTTQERDRFLYTMLWDMHKTKDGKFARLTSWQFVGVRVCQAAFLAFLGVSKTHYARRVESILEGSIEAPMDGRSIRTIRDRPAMMNADAFFNFLYLHVAEPLAEGWGHETEWDALEADDLEGGTFDVIPKELLEKGEAVNPFDEWVLGKGDSAKPANPDIASAVPAAARDQRWLNHCQISDLYAQYELWVSGAGGQPCSLSVFQKAWKKTWCGILRIRRMSQHSRCEDCSKYCEFRKAATAATRPAIEEAYSKHLKVVFMDREISARLALHSELSTSNDVSIAPSMATLYCSIDGMDQDFAQQIQENLKPQQNRVVRVEVLHGSYNFQAWHAPLRLNLAGLTITEHDKEVNHSFRIIQRRDLERYGTDWEIAQDVCEGTASEQSRDAILLVKHQMSSKELSQLPVLLLPAARVSLLSHPAPNELMDRNPISVQTAKKYQRTAEAVAAPPWNLTRARDYLMDLCRRNRAGLQVGGWLEPLHFLESAPTRLATQESSIALGEVPGDKEWHDFAPLGPKFVKVRLEPVTSAHDRASSSLVPMALLDDDASDAEPNLGNPGQNRSEPVESGVNMKKPKTKPMKPEIQQKSEPAVKLDATVKAEPATVKAEPKAEPAQAKAAAKAGPPERPGAPLKRPAASMPEAKAGPPERRGAPLKRPAASMPAGAAKAKVKAAPKPKGKHVSPYQWPANRNGLGCPKCKGRWDGCGQCRNFLASGKAYPTRRVIHDDDDAGVDVD
ncbi:Uncharacterized protein SCF082_LOCUS22283 [Durusdinium trenchii]|uniref:Uncharacterized protein n=1 Tax=Durusdinium trenchii TaxID=1381693 RepID=A0ABP0LEV5_9DINO